MSTTSNPVVLKKELLKLSKKEIIKKCKKNKIQSNGTKIEMINRLIVKTLNKKKNKPKNKKISIVKLQHHPIPNLICQLYSDNRNLYCIHPSSSISKFDLDYNKWVDFTDRNVIISNNLYSTRLAGFTEDDTALFAYSLHKSVFFSYNIVSAQYQSYSYILPSNETMLRGIIASKPYEFHAIWNTNLSNGELKHSVWDSTLEKFNQLNSNFPFVANRFKYNNSNITYDRLLGKIIAISIYTFTLEISECDVSCNDKTKWKWTKKKTISFPSQKSGDAYDDIDILYAFDSLLFVMFTESKMMYCCDFSKSYKWQKASYKLPNKWIKQDTGDRICTVLSNGNVHCIGYNDDGDCVHVSFVLSDIVPKQLYYKTRNGKKK
eukprot:522395_1